MINILDIEKLCIRSQKSRHIVFRKRKLLEQLFNIKISLITRNIQFKILQTFERERNRYIP